MALPIATVPVLTGEAAERFEAEAQKNYEKFLNRTDSERKAIHEQYERGMAIVKKVLANSSLKEFTMAFDVDRVLKELLHFTQDSLSAQIQILPYLEMEAIES
jgi:hypothetical protein